MLKKYISSFFIIAASLIFFSLSVKALTFEETALYLLEQSPEFKSENLSVESFNRNLMTENNLPDPELSGEYLFAPGDEIDKWGAELSWGIDWPGVYGAKNKESKAKMIANEKVITAARVKRLTEIKKLLLDYILVEKKIELIEHMRKDNDSIYTLAEKAASGGEMTVLDINKVRLENANLKVSRASLLDERSITLSSLASIYGNDCSEILSTMTCEFPVIEIPTQEEISKAIPSSAEVTAAMAETEVSRRGEKVALMEALPSLSVGYKHAFEEGFHFNGATLGISIPIFSSRNKRKAAKAAMAESEFKAESAYMSAATDINEAMKRLIIMDSQLKEIEPILQVTNHHTLLLKAYKGGVITLLDYLSERSYFTSASMDLLTLKHAAATAQIEIQGLLKSSY